MLIEHPLLGPRDAEEFTYLGDARLIDRPKSTGPDAADRFAVYVYRRENPSGLHRELWFHEAGDQSVLIVTRNTITHEITSVALARNAILAGGAQP
jgi:sarcosine oxidase subunit delta